MSLLNDLVRKANSLSGEENRQAVPWYGAKPTHQVSSRAYYIAPCGKKYTDISSKQEHMNFCKNCKRSAHGRPHLKAKYEDPL